MTNTRGELPFLPMKTVPIGQWRPYSMGALSMEEAEPLVERTVGMRRRVLPLDGSARVDTCSKRQNTKEVRVVHVVGLPALAFFFVVLVYVAVGVYCIAYRPRATEEVGPFKIPKDSQCFRAVRTADYTTINMALGTPFSWIEVLLRMDKVMDRGPGNLKLFSSRVAESKTVRCVNSTCADVALALMRGPNSHNKRIVASFQYPKAVNVQSDDQMAFQLGLDGEMYLSSGYDYFLTATHMCYAPTRTPASGSNFDMTGVVDEQGYMRTDGWSLAASRVGARTPVGAAISANACPELNSSRVRLFPVEAGNERTWLGLGSGRLYEYAESGITLRREVVEVGSHCAAKRYAHAYSLFKLECGAHGTPCELQPSIPFRRLAKSQMRIRIDAGSVMIWAVDDVRLHSMPKFSDEAESVGLAFAKLAVMLLLSGVVWIRSSKESSELWWLYVHALHRSLKIVQKDKNSDAGGSEDEDCDEVASLASKEPPANDMVTVAEDAGIGLVALVARMVICQWRLVYLEPDGYLRVCASEMVASGLSLLHWFVRYFVLMSDGDNFESPLVRLGGSTAAVDASCAVVIAFSEAPLLVTAIGRFDPTARLLTALLISLTTLQRCFFACASCTVRWAIAKDSSDCGFAYKFILFCSMWQWVLQAGSVAIVLSDAFVVPSVFSMTRTTVGDARMYAYVAFLTLTSAGLPQMVKTCREISCAGERKATA